MRSIGTSIFSTATQLAIKHGAINLAQGFPDFEPPADLVSAGIEAMAAGMHQYAPSVGLLGLRQAVADHARQQYGLHHDPETEVTITAGATEGMWTVATALLEPGDEVIILEPSYDSYGPSVVAAGGIPRFVPTLPFPRFGLDLERLEAAFSDRTRLVYVNTPGNPTGRLLTPVELRVLGELAERHDAYLLSDETYEHITFGGVRHRPVAADPHCSGRTITASSISKTFSATGWRVGWVVAPPAITDAVRKVHQFVTFAAPTPLQQGAAAMFAAAETSGYYEQLRAAYEDRRSILLSYLERTDLSVARPDGAYFVMTDCHGDDVEFCRDLTTRLRVTPIAASYFFEDRERGRGLVRFAFCKRVETLREAGERLLATG